jgi:hypothetical protein
MDTRPYLNTPERLAAAAVGFVLVVVGAILIANPPDRTQLVPGCRPDARTSCTVDVDSDPNVFAGVVAAIGGAAILIATLGVRFSSIKAGNILEASASFERETKGLTSVDLELSAVGAMDTSLEHPVPPKAPPAARGEEEAISFTPDVLNALLLSQHYGPYQRGIFLGHIVNPVPIGKRWEVAVFVTGSGNFDDVEKADFYFGPGWRSRTFEGKRDRHGHLGCVVTAFTDFVAYCRVTFRDGHTFLLQHYCNIGGPEASETRPVR